MKDQKFGTGDFAILDGKFHVRVVDCIQDEDGSWWYEVKPIDVDPVAAGFGERWATREVREDRLKAI